MDVVTLSGMMTIGGRNANVMMMNRKKTVRLVNEVNSFFDLIFLSHSQASKAFFNCISFSSNHTKPLNSKIMSGDYP